MWHRTRRRIFAEVCVVLITLVGISLAACFALAVHGRLRVDPMVNLDTPVPLVASPAVISPSRPAGCDSWPEKPALPHKVSVADVGPRGVQALPRKDDVAAVPTNTSMFAWDKESHMPGQSGGLVLLAAHTDHRSSLALGNRLIAELQMGELVRVAAGGKTLCYRVDERLQASVARYPTPRIYRATTEGLTITVCSGYNGRKYTQRTVWFAVPVK